MADLSVDVLCAYPINDLYDRNHRLCMYLALGTVLLFPKLKWLKSACLSLVVLYTLGTGFYTLGLYLAPDRLGPSMDIFALNSILVVDTYAMAAVVFLRPSTIKGKRSWAVVTRMFIWLWGSFYLSGWVKNSFEKNITSKLTTVNCSPDNSTISGNTFSAGQGLACQNPCSAHHTAIVWGTLGAASKTFSRYSRPDISTSELLVVITSAIVLTSTLWLNFFTSPQTTRNAVFAIFTRFRSESRGLRSALAKAIALLWYTWSYLCLLVVAIAFPGVIWIQEKLLQRYPVANTMCLVKQYLPWVIGMIVGVLKVAAIRRRRKEAAKVRSSRRSRLNKALASLRAQMEKAGLSANQISADTFLSDATAAASPKQAESAKTAASGETSEAPKAFKFPITKVRKIDGFFDHFKELGEWWVNPTGESEVRNSVPSVDEEKALLKDHYSQQD
jgi:hypothetical protein